MSFLSRCAALGSLTLLSPASAQAVTTLTFQPDNSSAFNGDAFVTTGTGTTLASNNYGGAGALAVSATSAILSRGTFDSVLRFDLNPGPTSIKTTFDSQFGAGLWTVDAVTLTLTVNSPNNAIFNGFVGNLSPSNSNTAGLIGIRWLPIDSWTEGSGTPSSTGQPLSGINYNTLAVSNGANPIYETGYQSLGTFNFGPGLTSNNTAGTFTASFAPSAGLLSDILSNVSHNTGTFELVAGDSVVSAQFNSRNNGTISNRPLLTIHAIAAPEPGRAVLLSLGLIASAFRRRRKFAFTPCCTD